MLLVAAATEGELAGAVGVETLVCGVGPVDAAARTAAALAERRPDALLLVGIAGVHGFERPQLVIGAEAVYCDADDERWFTLRIKPDNRLLEAARRALPDARVAPIGTTARVGGATGCEVEAMEGYAVLRAAELADVPALEVRALANEIREDDRTKWRYDEAKAVLGEALPRLLAALSPESI